MKVIVSQLRSGVELCEDVMEVPLERTPSGSGVLLVFEQLPSATCLLITFGAVSGRSISFMVVKGATYDEAKES